jgi:hypothetical protein
MAKTNKDETSIRRPANPRSASQSTSTSGSRRASGKAKAKARKRTGKPRAAKAADASKTTTVARPAAKKAAPLRAASKVTPKVAPKAKAAPAPPPTRARAKAQPSARRVARVVPPPSEPQPQPQPRVADWAGLGEQEIVGAVKYGAAPAPGAFDEQRFLFPRNYEQNRVRLVVRDPEWLFAYWDVNPRAFETIRREMGERAMALSRLTLQVGDPDGGTTQVILLPYGARSWYVRIDAARPNYRAELGITLPSGQFRTLAQSNVVSVPRVGPSPHAAARSVEYRQAWASTDAIASGVEDEAMAGGPAAWLDPGTSIRPSPEELAGGASDRLAAELNERRAREARPGETRGGASDLFRR